MLVVFDHTPAFEGRPFLVLSERSSVDINALKRQGMTISEIARRTHHDRKKIRAYLNGERTPGQRERAAPDPFDLFVDYVTARLTEDPHLVGGDAAGRARAAGLRRLVSDADPADPGTRTAAPVHRIRAAYERPPRRRLCQRRVWRSRPCQTAVSQPHPGTIRAGGSSGHGEDQDA
ncbi:hypothetical protein [Raineyella sp. W15-4]|uniref:hypothetical protein n=1 Tax=Raineyella sp. W15-4 TaxID=3081651 RepID=UPI0029538EC5|nr:hypothetical protein [Raineyella sp. W15-4]WOQ15458.1 hypothetical protein R0145_09335 [Raineyella sp. W15-4]